MYCSSSSCRLANAKKENVDPCSRKDEGLEGSDRHQVLMVGSWDLCLDHTTLFRSTKQ